MQSAVSEGNQVAKWTATALAELVPGTKKTWWWRTGIPMLVQAGVLKRVGSGLFGRRLEIEQAFVNTDKPAA